MLVILSLIILSSAYAFASTSTVSVLHPLDQQLPLIARSNAPFSWTFSSNTFVSSSKTSLQYTASELPAWLQFDSSALALHGTPTSSDEGTPEVTITARDPVSNDTASSAFTLYVTPYAPPVLHHPVTEQFKEDNPSLSSVFLLSPNSALQSGNAALRIPPKWSFSIGFDGDTFTSNTDVYYAALQANGSDLPPWIEFNPETITFNGVTPAGNTSAPQTASFALHASDQEGYSASVLAFDVVVAAHELSMSTPSLPTINVTAATTFNLSLGSPADFYGVLLDGKAIGPDDVTSLVIDTSNYGSWLKYDSSSKTLSGQPPADLHDESQNPLLPVVLTSSINQTIHTNVSLAVVSSYFSAATLQPILAGPGQNIHFNLIEDFSNQTGIGNGQADVNLTAAFDPIDAATYLNFDSSTAQLTGTIPSNSSSAGMNYTHITVTFTAYSHVTHSTSHTSLPVSLTPSDYAHQHSHGLSEAARARLLLGLKIAFGIIGGLVFFGICLATLRRCARVPDTAASGEDGTRAWSAEEKKWYGIGIEVAGESSPAGSFARASQAEQGHGTPRMNEKYGNLGLGLQRILTRTPSITQSTTSPVQSPGVMRKREFLARLKETARNVSDKYKSAVNGPRRPVISRPTLIMATHPDAASSLPATTVGELPFETSARNSEALPFEDMDMGQYAPSGMTSLINSPSSSTGGRSIPRRRADFEPPRSSVVLTTPPQAHMREHSADSETSSLTSNSSSHTNEAEAVVMTATRAISVRSLGASSFKSNAEAGEGSRPRLVPFTSANRVPVPKVSVISSPDVDDSSPGGASTTRHVSQMAKVYRKGSRQNALPIEKMDDLSVGIKYVTALGDDASGHSHVRSESGSFSSLESSQHGHSNGGKDTVPTRRVLARIGEPFKFRLPVTSDASNSRTLETRLMSGKMLPNFIKADMCTVGARGRPGMELSGTPTVKDIGELNVGVYERGSGECVGRVVMEIVERSG